MRFYLNLQSKRIGRLIRTAGFHPAMGVILLLAVFLFSSIMLFQRLGYAEYVYPLVGLALLSVLGRRERNEFLKNTFTVGGYRKIRMVENSTLIAPFALFLLFKGYWIETLVMWGIAVLMAFLNQGSKMGWAFPTPFSRWPFEFTAGFRRTWWIFPLSYALAYFALQADNFNLAIFALVASFLPCLNYYSKPEPTFFVWIFSATPAQFLWSKIKIAMGYSLLISLPLMLALMAFEPTQFYLVLLFEVVGMAYVVASLLGKYAFFPTEINLIQGIVLALSIWFPPLLVFVIPYFYSKAKVNLQSVLT